LGKKVNNFFDDSADSGFVTALWLPVSLV